MIGVIVLDNGIGHVVDLAADAHLVRLVAAGTQNRAAYGQDAGQGAAVQALDAVLRQAPETFAKTDHLHAEMADRGLAHAADGGVQTRAVAARCQDADLFCHDSPVLFVIECRYSAVND
jgi:hypothetical protein